MGVTGPDPEDPAPLPGFPRVGFLRPFAAGRENPRVGRYSYCDDPEGPERVFDRDVLHHCDFVGDRLEIGAFCAFATSVRILMNGADHAMGGFSSCPFNVFGGGRGKGFDPASWEAENRGDTIIGHDVWIGHEALILPGTRIGTGAIVAARAVVGGHVPPYAVAAGNPGRGARVRFDPGTVEALPYLAWWDWPPARITARLAAIRGADLPEDEEAGCP